MMKCKIQKLHDDAILPEYSHNGDSGMDVYAVEDCYIAPMTRELIPLGFCVSIPTLTEIQVRPKSGLALKNGLTVLNTPGTIDSNYRGELCVILFNSSDEAYQVKKGQKVAQIVLCPVLHVEQWSIVKDIESETSRGSGGFGSTGI